MNKMWGKDERAGPIARIERSAIRVTAAAGDSSRIDPLSLLGFGDHFDRLPRVEADCLCHFDQLHCVYAFLTSFEGRNERLVTADALGDLRLRQLRVFPLLRDEGHQRLVTRRADGARHSGPSSRAGS